MIHYHKYVVFYLWKYQTSFQINDITYEVCTMMDIVSSDNYRSDETYSCHGNQIPLWWYQRGSDNIILTLSIVTHVQG